MQKKPHTQQYIIGVHSVHHRTGDKPQWSGNDDEWPVCTKCGKDILTTGDSESGPMWACSDPECEMH